MSRPSWITLGNIKVATNPLSPRKPHLGSSGICTRPGPVHRLPPVGRPGAPTCAERSRVLVVAAVVHAPAQAQAGCQAGLAAFTVHVVQQDVSGAKAEEGVSGGGQGLPAAQLAADHGGVWQPPVIVAHSAPQASVQDLHSALTGACAPHQAHTAFTW